MGCAGSKNRLSVVQRPPRAPVEATEGDDGIVIEPQRLAAAEAELEAEVFAQELQRLRLTRLEPALRAVGVCGRRELLAARESLLTEAGLGPAALHRVRLTRERERDSVSDSTACPMPLTAEQKVFSSPRLDGKTWTRKMRCAPPPLPLPVVCQLTTPAPRSLARALLPGGAGCHWLPEDQDLLVVPIRPAIKPNRLTNVPPAH